MIDIRDQVRKGARIRIVARRNKSGNIFVKGQDTRVYLVRPSLTDPAVEELINLSAEAAIVGARWWVDSRRDYCRAILECSSVEIDADARLGDVLDQTRAENDKLRERVRELEDALVATKLLKSSEDV
jgi:hypothetical protein